MLSKRMVGWLCPCGQPIPLPDGNVNTFEDFVAYRELRRCEGWSLVGVHGPGGCGRETRIAPDNLILIEFEFE